MDEIDVLAMLDQQLKEQFKNNPHIDIRRLAQGLYKDATDGKKNQWLQTLQEQREERFWLMK
jgi:hypothetical protein